MKDKDAGQAGSPENPGLRPLSHPRSRDWEDLARRAEELRSLLQSAETNERFAHIYACTPEQAAGYAARAAARPGAGSVTAAL